jgi:PHD/YefM family antitoxin component YafN of YafNO toxin-antitoxin module
MSVFSETDYLLSNPAKAAHLSKSLEQARTGHVAEIGVLYGNSSG